MILITLLGVTPLSHDQSAQLSTAADDSARLDEGALYPLLQNAMTWEPGDEAGAQVPDYAGLLADPAIGRGELFLVEGRFAGRARRYGLVRSGAWGRELTEWVLLVSDDPEQVAVVYFVDPQASMKAPSTGMRVRVVGRFYKVWADTDQLGAPARYLTFVARSASVGGVKTADKGYFAWLLLVVVMLLTGGYIALRRMGRSPRPTHRRPTMDDAAMLSHSEDLLSDQPLPDNPAEALRRMAEQREKT